MNFADIAILQRYCCRKLNNYNEIEQHQQNHENRRIVLIVVTIVLLSMEIYGDLWTGVYVFKVIQDPNPITDCSLLIKNEIRSISLRQLCNPEVGASHPCNIYASHPVTELFAFCFASPDVIYSVTRV